MRKLILVAAAAIAVAGCSNKGADTDGDGKISDAEAKAEMSAGGAMAMKPGLWEVKVAFDKLDAPGVSEAVAAQMKKQMGQGATMNSCMTKEQAEKPGGDFFGAPPEANCTFDALARSGNDIDVAMTCKPGGNMTIKSKMDGSFAAENYTMDIEQTTEGTPMGPIKMSGKIVGRRTGDCPA